ncbi:MAG: acyltransferase [Pirellulales bacterium]
MSVAPRVMRLFRRVTTSGGYVPEIDGLRFVAIMPVLAFHLWGYWGRIEQRPYPDPWPLDYVLNFLVSLGHYGVHLFFMISGFVLATPFSKHALEGAPAVDLKRYFWRRITRLEPPYVVSMLLFFLVAPLAAKGSWADLFPHLLASLGYVHELVYGTGSPINNNAWSLEIEVQFYLLMPLLASVLWLPPVPRRILMACVIAILSTHALWLSPTAPRTIVQYGQFFLTGVLLNDLWTTGWRDTARSMSADVPGVTAWPAFFAANIFGSSLFVDLVAPWIIAGLFYSALRGRCHSAILAYGAIPLIGGMCYSIYLLHARVIALTVHAVGAAIPSTGSFCVEFTIAFVICTVAVLIVSGCFFLLIEKPCMDPQWPQHLYARLGGMWRERRLQGAGK